MLGECVQGNDNKALTLIQVSKAKMQTASETDDTRSTTHSLACMLRKFRLTPVLLVIDTPHRKGLQVRKSNLKRYGPQQPAEETRFRWTSKEMGEAWKSSMHPDAQQEHQSNHILTEQSYSDQSILEQKTTIEQKE